MTAQDVPEHTVGTPPPRPTEDSPAQTGFTRRPMVGWLSPKQLASTALRVVLSGFFGSYADRREVEAALPAWTPPSYAGGGGEAGTPGGDLWIDYVADIGEGFDATYSVASRVAAPTLTVDGHVTRRADVLVFGGDQVYPTPSEGYEDRCVGPWRAALPWTDAPHPHLYAIPGNHDWYDGLTAFLRTFCRKQWVGGWQTQQCRSYFALQLPNGWHLWAIDLQLDSYVDEPQLAYFRKAAEDLGEGHQVVLCSATPSWVYANEREEDRESFAKLDYFERTLIHDKGATIAVTLTGDAHHYARYTSEDGSHKITCGLGGAFLSSTHHLPDEVTVPPATSRDPGKSAPVTYVRKAVWPTFAESKRRRLTVLPAVVARNKSFGAGLGAAHLLYGFFAQAAVRRPGDGFGRALSRATPGEIVQGLALGSPGAAALSLVVLRGLVGFTGTDRRRRLVAGPLHTVAHLASIVGTVWLGGRTAAAVGDGGWATLAAIATTGVAGAVAGSVVLAAYLSLADLAGMNDNELFAAHKGTGYKGFLRMHLSSEGLTIYPIGLERTSGSWSLAGPTTDPSAPWFVSTEPPSSMLEPRLIEQPIFIKSKEEKEQ